MTRSFKPKTPIFFHNCNCGHHTILKNMVPARARCKCGKDFTYLTNASAPTISIASICCGAPMDLEWNYKKGAYLTIDDDRKHK